MNASPVQVWWNPETMCPCHLCQENCRQYIADGEAAILKATRVAAPPAIKSGLPFPINHGRMPPPPYCQRRSPSKHTRCRRSRTRSPFTPTLPSYLGESAVYKDVAALCSRVRSLAVRSLPSAAEGSLGLCSGVKDEVQHEAESDMDEAASAADGSLGEAASNDSWGSDPDPLGLFQHMEHEAAKEVADHDPLGLFYDDEL
jgi:hypothetical protein